MGNEETFDEIFSFFDGIVKNILDEEVMEEKLCKTYENFCDALSVRIGTGRGVSGIAEYLMVLAVRKIIEKEFKGKFRSDHVKKGVHVFKLGDIIMTHDIDVSKRISENKLQGEWRPDIAIIKDGKLISVFQIKAALTSFYAWDMETERANEFVNKKDNSPKIYWVFLHVPSDFPKLPNHKAFVGEQTGKDTLCSITLKDAINATIQDLNKK
jgi:hypothetical protein